MYSRRTQPKRAISAGGVFIAFIAVIGMIVYLQGMRFPKTVEPRMVYRYMEEKTKRTGIEPGFVFSIAMGMSQFDPKSHTERGRGIMGVPRSVWDQVSELSYKDHAFNWKLNVSAGIDYLEACKKRLESQGKFSYPLLAAMYYYGASAVEDTGFDLTDLPDPKNDVFRRLFAGEVTPITLADESFSKS